MFYILTCLRKGKGIENSSSTSGLTQHKIFTSILLYGTLRTSCKFFTPSKLFYLIFHVKSRKKG